MFCLREKFCCTAVSRVFGYSRYTKDTKVRTELKTDANTIIGSVGNPANVDSAARPAALTEEQRLSSAPIARRDGTIVAEAIELRQRLQELGSKLLEELAYKSNEKYRKEQMESRNEAETITNVLARYIAKESFEKIKSGASPTEIRRGIMLAVNEIKKHLKDISRPISTPDDIEQVAGIYAGDKSICNVVCEAIKNVCRDGVIYVRKSKRMYKNHKIELIDGIRLNTGYISPYFINTMNGERIHFHKSLILLSSDEITSAEMIKPAIELARSTNMPLLIIAKDIDSISLRYLVLKRLTANLKVAFVVAPGLGDTRNAILRDISISTGGKVFGYDNNMLCLENVDLKDFGRVNDVVISKDQTLLLNGMGKRNEIERRIEEIKEQIADATTTFRKRLLRERLMNLVLSVVLINVVGDSEKMIQEQIQRINDTVNATREAMEEGIVPGGGIALLKCISCLNTVVGCNNTQRMGIDIVRRALRIPWLNTALNAGMDASILELHIDDSYGYDILKGEPGLFVEMGLVEPTTLVRKAVEKAAGVTSLITKADCTIAKSPKAKNTKFE